MFVVWLRRVHRPTKDLDLLGAGKMDAGILKVIMEEVCQAKVEADGVEFDAGSVVISEIRAGQEYPGLRVKVRGLLGTARLSVQIDVGFGDAVIPRPEEADYPTLLTMPAPRLRVYAKETSIAEKVDAICSLGMSNTRMKDYFDICVLSRNFSFSGKVLTEAIASTFRRRGRSLKTGLAVGLSEEFAADSSKVRQWSAFLGKQRSVSEVSTDLGEVVREVRDLVGPVVEAVVEGREFLGVWGGEGWRRG